MNNKDIQTKIDNYLLSQMSEVEIQAFEAEMATDSLLNETVELQRLLVTEIKQRAFISEIIKETEERINKAKPENKTVPLTVSEATVELKPAAKKIPFRLKMTLAWSAAAIFIGVFFVNNAVQNSRMDNLYVAYYAAPQADVMRGDGTRGTNPEEVELMTAINYLENRNPKQAHEILLKLYQNSDESIYSKDIRWYLALTELKLHNKSKAKKYLEELIDSEFYGTKASKLLEEL
jgi:hypothetical protein